MIQWPPFFPLLRSHPKPEQAQPTKNLLALEDITYYSTPLRITVNAPYRPSRVVNKLVQLPALLHTKNSPYACIAHSILQHDVNPSYALISSSSALPFPPLPCPALPCPQSAAHSRPEIVVRYPVTTISVTTRYSVCCRTETRGGPELRDIYDPEGDERGCGIARRGGGDGDFFP
eukprot:765191-Hanusia_phi.AAC.4